MQSLAYYHNPIRSGVRLFFIYVKLVRLFLKQLLLCNYPYANERSLLYV